MGFVLSKARRLPPSEQWDAGSEMLPRTHHEGTVSERIRVVCWPFCFGSWSNMSVCTGSGRSKVLFGLFSILKWGHKHCCQRAFKKQEAWPFWWVFLGFSLDQEDASAFTNKVPKVCYYSWMCANFNWHEGESAIRDELLPSSQGFLCIFHCNIQRTKKVVTGTRDL